MTGLALGFLVAWAAYRQQGAKLAEADSLPAGRSFEPEAASLLALHGNDLLPL